MDSRLTAAQQRAVAAYRSFGVTGAARELGIHRRNMQRILQRAESISPGVLTDARRGAPAEQPLIDRPVHELVADRIKRIEDRSDRALETPVLPCPAKPFVVWHDADEHLDDNGCRLDLLRDDLDAAKRLGAERVGSGDMLNSWPVAGRLAAKWAEQEATLPEGLLLAKWSIEYLTPSVFVFGNHDVMNPYLREWLLGVLPGSVLTGWWALRFVYRPPYGREFVVAVNHDFSQGKSWFHPLHGHIREDLEGAGADIYIAGHLHCDGVLAFTNGRTGRRPLMVRSRGYKHGDGFAARIGKAGDASSAQATWLVLDPRESDDAQSMFAFPTWRGAEAMLNGLQNLKAV